MIEERLSTIKAEAEAADAELSTLVSEAEVEEAESPRARLSRIRAEADAAVGEIPPPCEHEEHEHEPEPVIERHPRMERVGGHGVVIMLDRQEGDQWHRMSELQFSPDPVEDLVARDDGVKGAARFAPGDRWGYAAGWWFIQHIDPGHHGWIDTLRFFVVAIRDGIRVNDLSMPESPEVNGVPVQGLPPYPYEPGFPNAPVLRDHPGGTVQLFHQRGFSADLRHPGLGRQLLWEFDIPAKGTLFRVPRGDDPTVIEQVDCLYQGRGRWIYEHAELGPVAEMILAAMNSRYAFGVKGVSIP